MQLLSLNKIKNWSLGNKGSNAFFVTTPIEYIVSFTFGNMIGRKLVYNPTSTSRNRQNMILSSALTNDKSRIGVLLSVFLS